MTDKWRKTAAGLGGVAMIFTAACAHDRAVEVRMSQQENAYCAEVAPSRWTIVDADSGQVLYYPYTGGPSTPTSYGYSQGIINPSDGHIIDLRMMEKDSICLVGSGMWDYNVLYPLTHDESKIRQAQELTDWGRKRLTIKEIIEYSLREKNKNDPKP